MIGNQHLVTLTLHDSEVFKMSRSERSQTPLQTTGALEQGVAPPSVIGRPHGETGSGRKIQRRDIEARDRTLTASLPPAVVSQLVCDKRSLFVDGEFAGLAYDIRIRQPFPPAGLMHQARMMVAEATAPMDARDILKRLMALKVKTAQRRTSGEETELQLQLYVDELAGWPADVVAYVLETQPSASQWWPTWFELNERLSLYGRRRMAMKAAFDV